jgi:hypothetical protein
MQNPTQVNGSAAAKPQASLSKPYRYLNNAHDSAHELCFVLHTDEPIVVRLTIRFQETGLTAKY